MVYLPVRRLPPHRHVEASYALRVLDAGEGHCGYLLKDRVLDAGELERVASGETVVDHELVTQLLARRREPGPLDDLTDREREVLAQLRT